MIRIHLGSRLIVGKVVLTPFPPSVCQQSGAQTGELNQRCQMGNIDKQIVNRTLVIVYPCHNLLYSQARFQNCIHEYILFRANTR